MDSQSTGSAWTEDQKTALHCAIHVRRNDMLWDEVGKVVCKDREVGQIYDRCVDAG